MFSNKWVAFGVGVAAGFAAAALIRTPVFRKACVAVTEKGMLLKQEAAAFMEAIKEDAQDIAAEAAYNQSQNV